MEPAQPAAMGPQMREALAAAKRRRRKLDRAAGVAAFNAWTSASLAVLCLPFALFSAASLAAAVVLGAVAYVEFTGRRKLRELDESGPVMLTCNQLALGAVVILYAAWHLWLAYTGRGYAGRLSAELGSQVADLNTEGLVGLFRTVEYLTYTLLIAGTLLFQGLTAWYYWTRRTHLRAFVSQTPRWAIDLLRAAA